jgi:hypothetical protein
VGEAIEHHFFGSVIDATGYCTEQDYQVQLSSHFFGTKFSNAQIDGDTRK